MDFGQIIRRSWQLVLKHRFLWWLGLLVIFSPGPTFIWPNFFGGFGSPPSSRNQSFRSMDQEKLTEAAHQARIWADQHWIGIALGIILLVIIFLIAWYVSLSAKAGLILAVNDLEKNQQTSFAEAYHRGRSFVWRLLGLALAVLALLLISLPVLILVSGGAFLIGSAISPVFGLLGLGGLLIVVMVFLIFVNYLLVLAILAERVIVLKNRGVFESISLATQLIGRQLGHSLITWLINIALSLACGLVFGLSLIILMTILLGIGSLIFLASHVAAAVFAGLAALILIAGFLAIGSIFKAFIFNYWTLSYLALDYLQEQPVKS